MGKLIFNQQLQVSKTYASNDCLGTREIIAEEDEVQPNGKKFKKLVLGKYNWRTFEDFACEASIISQALRNLGLKPRDKIAILAETRAEWILTAYACFKNNITIVTVYTNLGSDGVVSSTIPSNIILYFSSDSISCRLMLSMRPRFLSLSVPMRHCPKSPQ